MQHNKKKETDRTRFRQALTTEKLRGTSRLFRFHRQILHTKVCILICMYVYIYIYTHIHMVITYKHVNIYI